MMLKRILLLTICFVIPSATFALDELAKEKYTPGEKVMQQDTEKHCQVFRLWPGDGTRADDPFKGNESMKKWLNGVSAPSMMVFKPDKQDGRAVLLFPGGAYRFLAAKHEGTEVAKC